MPPFVLVETVVSCPIVSSLGILYLKYIGLPISDSSLSEISRVQLVRAISIFGLFPTAKLPLDGRYINAASKTAAIMAR